ncbi:MAG TPA: hypothetical protein VK421_17900 [Pyrinomonadaceae bacterium]|nr:hypothetical protein [Pyrinomonadaceae bacterium]
MRRAQAVSRDHPLRHFFTDLVRRRFDADVRLADPRLAAYVSGLLVDFTHVDNLYRVRDARGRRLEDVGEMLLESNPLLEAASFDREREVRKHVGDYVLFVAGLFPESLSGRQRFRQMRLDVFVDYMRAGKESYEVVSAFDQFEYRDEAPLFRRLADNFELCVFGLNLVKEDLERLQRSYYQGLRQALEG